MWNTIRDKIEDFLVKANSFHPTIKFTAEISETETTFLDTKVYKGDRFKKESILDVRTHFKAAETFQYTNFYSWHPPGITYTHDFYPRPHPRPTTIRQTPLFMLCAVVVFAVKIAGFFFPEPNTWLAH